MKVREILRLLAEDGWIKQRQAGGHRQFRHSRKPGTVTVSGNSGDEVAIGTLRNIFRQAGIDWSTRR